MKLRPATRQNTTFMVVFLYWNKQKMPQNTKELEFAPPFSGEQTEITELEAAEAASNFKSGIDDLLLENADDVMHSSWVATHPHSDSDNLKLMYFPYAPERRRLSYKEKWPSDPSIRMWVELKQVLKDGEPISDPSIEIFVTEADSSRNDIRNIAYLLRPGDQQVIRHEANDAHSLWHGGWERTLGQIMLGTNSLKVAEEQINEQKNGELEREMGLNDQVVGRDEVEALLALLNKSCPVTPTGNEPIEK